MANHSGFISWSSLDPRASAIAALFKEWATALFGDRVELFLSNDDIRPADSWASVVRQRLNTSTFGIVLLSPQSARSPWVLFEAGCLKVPFPVLVEMTPERLADVCPPLATLQTVTALDRRSLGKMVRQIVTLIDADADAAAIESSFEVSFAAFEAALRAALAEQASLPEDCGGTVAYNRYITDSRNFQMPRIFELYRRELFLVGINLNFLLNLRDDARNFESLLASLVADRGRRCQILIADLWDDKILYTYDKVVRREGLREFGGLNEVFTDATSALYIDTFVRRCVGERYDDVAARLTIKKIGLLMDTFWFVDSDAVSKTGSMLFAPMTASGRERPVFFISEKHQGDIFGYYRSVCESGYHYADATLWPPPSRQARTAAPNQIP